MMADRASGQTDGISHAPARPLARLHVLIFVCVLVAEASLFAAGALGFAGSIRLLLIHLLIVGVAAVLLWRPLLSGADGGVALLGTLAVLATGPLGALGALLLPRLAARDAVSGERLQAWYKRIALSAEQDDFTRLSDRVAIGRAANLAAPSPQVLTELFRSGPIGAQQSALGMIARGFHPGYLPVLKIALDSPEPVIRVQAAAVAARVRGQLKTYVETLFQRSADPTLSADQAIEIAAELRESSHSGLLEAAERARSLGVHDALLARTYARMDARQRSSGQSHELGPQLDTGSDVVDAYEAHLLAQGRFEDYRAIRLRVRRPVTGRYRRRQVALRRVHPSVKLAEVRR